MQKTAGKWSYGWSGYRRNIHQSSYQKPTGLDEYPCNQCFGDDIFDIYLVFSHNILDDIIQHDTYQRKISEVFHDIPYLPKIDIHMDDRSIYSIIGHELSCKDSKNHPSSWTKL